MKNRIKQIQPLPHTFSFSNCSWGCRSKNTGVVCHSLLQWTTLCQNSPLWPVHLRWPCTAWLIASLSFASPFSTTRLWSQNLQARLQHCINWETPDVQAGFRKGRGTRDQIANICWIIEKAREFQKNICFLDYTKAFDCVNHSKLEHS